MRNTERASITPGSVGFISQRIVYKGVSAHAGGAPWNGCNALYAATLGINAVNAIPDKVVLESSVRGTSFEGIDAANKRVNRALIGAALSLGANVDIQNTPGYAPLLTAGGMARILRYRTRSLRALKLQSGKYRCLRFFLRTGLSVRIG